MTRRSRREVERALSDVEEQFGAGPTEVVIVTGGTETDEWPDEVSWSDIVIEQEQPGADPSTPLVTETVPIPIHRPRPYRGGVVVMSHAEIAHVYATMPEDVREAERERRREAGKPTPPILREGGDT